MSSATTPPHPSREGRRQVVKFSFFKVAPGWRALPPAEREAGKEQFCGVVAEFGSRLLIRSYSLMGTRGDADFLLWQIGDRLEDIRELATALFSTPIGPYLDTPYSYLAMTRRSSYVVKDEPEGGESRLLIRPTSSRYFFVYPFVKTRAWYQLSQEERQAMMDEHIRIGRKYPSVKLNTTYSFGLDDQEFVVAFETDEPSDFLDLVMELRETRGSLYTERDTPIFSCIAMSLRETLESLGAMNEGDGEKPAPKAAPFDSWTKAADISDLVATGRKAIYFQGEEIALFNSGGVLHAVANRCPHANGSLLEGCLEANTLTCALHGSQFDLVSGKPLRGPATRSLAVYRTRIEGDSVFLAPPGGQAV